jgi:hypothetical protein
MQGSLPAGWLAFTGRELNPLDRDEGFQITSSSLPGLFLAQRPKTCTKGDVETSIGGAFRRVGKAKRATTADRVGTAFRFTHTLAIFYSQERANKNPTEGSPNSATR